MDKYQRALNSLESRIQKRSTTIKDVAKEVGTLQELIDKATPQKPEFDYDDDTYKCPCCDKEYETYYDGYLKSFCSECGQALDWSDFDES